MGEGRIAEYLRHGWVAGRVKKAVCAFRYYALEVKLIMDICYSSVILYSTFLSSPHSLLRL